MKKMILMLALAVMLLSSTGAQAYFEDIDVSGPMNTDASTRISLYGTFLKTGNMELAVDLLDASQTFRSATALDPEGIASASRTLTESQVFTATTAGSWSEVRFGGFGGYRSGTTQSELYAFMTAPTLVGTPGEYALSGYAGANTAADTVSAQFGGAQPSSSWTFTQSATNANSFAKKMDNFSTGNLAGITTGGDVLNLGMWDTNEDYVYTLYLYGFNFASGVTTLMSEQPMGMLTLSLEGANVLVEYSAVPVPAAIWVLGSGLVGVIGLRRRRQA